MSNFVFSRRALQRSIGHLARVLQGNQLASIVDRLNRANDGRLPAMWELVMLDALARVGVLRHEVRLPNGRFPDIELTVSSTEGMPFQIIGDVATVSDAGLDEQNPIEVLHQELIRLATKARLNPNHFGCKVRGDREGAYGDGRMKLFLPAKGQLSTLMKKVVEPWVHRLKANQNLPDSFNYDDGDTSFSLTYDPTQLYFHSGHLSYDVAVSRDKNPLFRALKGKVSQLKQAPQEALRLIIACDGDCALLRQSALMYSPGTFSATEVAEDFLRQNSSIDAVLLVTIDEQLQGLGYPATYRTKYDLVVAPPQARSSRMTPSAIAKLEKVIRDAFEHVPQPMRTAYNAAIRCRVAGCGPDMIGGYKMSSNYISLSSRALQRLLAGEMTVDDFIAAHGWEGTASHRNPFANMAHFGRMITKIDVESGGDQDDDWLTFQFGQPDPAAAAFCIPLMATQPQSDNVKGEHLQSPTEDAD